MLNTEPGPVHKGVATAGEMWSIGLLFKAADGQKWALETTGDPSGYLWNDLLPPWNVERYAIWLLFTLMANFCRKNVATMVPNFSKKTLQTKFPYNNLVEISQIPLNL